MDQVSDDPGRGDKQRGGGACLLGFSVPIPARLGRHDDAIGASKRSMLTKTGPKDR